MTTRLLFDLESTGLLRRGSTVHCIVMRNLNEPDDHIVLTTQSVTLSSVKQLEMDTLIGHNIITSIPLKEQYDNLEESSRYAVLSRLFYPHIDRDASRS